MWEKAQGDKSLTKFVSFLVLSLHTYALSLLEIVKSWKGGCPVLCYYTFLSTYLIKINT